MRGDSQAKAGRPSAKTRGGGAAPSFAESESADRFERLRALLPERAAANLASDLAAAGDADRALLQLEVLLQRHPAAAKEALSSSSLALRAVAALFGSSQWLGQTLLQNPDLLRLFARRGGLSAGSSREILRERLARFRMRQHSRPLPATLARFKRREYVRIFVRELLGLASLPEIAGEISGLSDALIDVALSHAESVLRGRYRGWPQLRSKLGYLYPGRFAVLSLGKLGGNELNYSSDIDLLYLYDDAEDAATIAVSARQFFTELAQELTSLLSEVGPEGQAFRVDLRLRPRGASGEMVAGRAQALRYYRNEARDWELQALLKLRQSSGDLSLGREFVEKAQRLIYSDQLSLSAIRTAAQSLEQIQRGSSRQGNGGLDVKSAPGGLREIEFAVQCLQRVHGGGEPWLRSSGTLFALQKLHDKGHIGHAEFRELGATYSLLRAIEHRLQCRQGAQIHRLPEDARERAAVFATLRGWRGGEEELRRAMSSAAELCARVLRLGTAEEKTGITALSVSLGEPGMERLSRELAARSPLLAETLAANVGDAALRGLRRFLAAASTGEQRIATAVENTEWIERGLPVFAQSAMANSILSCHPEDVVALFRDREPASERPVSDRLRIAARRSMLRAAGRTLLEGRPIWETMRWYSETFDRIVGMALEASAPPEGFAVFALGRLGTCELDVFSDADLVFLHGAECDAGQAGRCAQAVVEMLSGYTREGSAIQVDTRLRPHGAEGSLAVSLRQLGQYCEGGAKPWEVVAFAKLRRIAGDEWLAGETAAHLARLRQRFAALPEFAGELRLMRQKIADASAAENVKTAPGGLYDLDFCLGLLEAREQLPAAGRQLRERITALHQRQLLTAPQTSALQRAAELFRTLEHAVRVVEGRQRKWLPESDALRQRVEHLVGRVGLEKVLREQMQAVRAVYELILGAY